MFRPRRVKARNGTGLDTAAVETDSPGTRAGDGAVWAHGTAGSRYAEGADFNVRLGLGTTMVNSSVFLSSMSHSNSSPFSIPSAPDIYYYLIDLIIKKK